MDAFHWFYLSCDENYQNNTAAKDHYNYSSYTRFPRVWFWSRISNIRHYPWKISL